MSKQKAKIRCSTQEDTHHVWSSRFSYQGQQCKLQVFGKKWFRKRHLKKLTTPAFSTIGAASRANQTLALWSRSFPFSYHLSGPVYRSLSARLARPGFVLAGLAYPTECSHHPWAVWLSRRWLGLVLAVKSQEENALILANRRCLKQESPNQRNWEINYWTTFGCDPLFQVLGQRHNLSSTREISSHSSSDCL